MLRMIHSVDRPTNNTLIFLTRVQAHKIVRDERLCDPYVYSSLEEIIGREALDEFEGFTRSFYSLEGHYANLWLYDRPFRPRCTDPVYTTAVEITREAFRLPSRVESISWDNLSAVPFIRTSGAGWKYVGKKGDGDNHTLAISRAVGSLRSWEERQHNWRYTPDMAWTRTQIGSFENPKIRNVWGKAFHNIILEGISAFPLIDAYQKQVDSPIVVGVHLYKRLPVIIRDILQDGDDPLIGIGIDFKAFDTTPQPWMIEDAFNILQDNIRFVDEEGQSSWNYAKEFFINTPVIMPDGRMWLKRLGIPSGSYFTQLIGSVINHIVITYIQLKYWGRTFKMRVLGDDSAFGVPYKYGWPDVVQLSKIGQELDFTIHPEKVNTSRPDEMEFLGHVARGL